MSFYETGIYLVFEGETYPKKAVGVYCYKANDPKLSDYTQHLYNISHIYADLS